MSFVPKCVASISLVLVVCSTASAEKPDDEQMAREALAPFVSSRMLQGDKQAKIQEVHASVRTRASEAPTREMSVKVVFGTGLSTKEVNGLVDRYNLEIVDMHLKAPYNDRGVVQSFDVGAAELARFKGGFAARAEKAIGVIRYNLITMARTMPPDVAKAYKEIAMNDILVYRIDAYSQSQKIADLLDHSDVALVISENVERGDAKIASHKAMRTRAEDIWTRIPAGNATTTKLEIEE